MFRQDVSGPVGPNAASEPASSARSRSVPIGDERFYCVILCRADDLVGVQDALHNQQYPTTPKIKTTYRHILPDRHVRCHFDL